MNGDPRGRNSGSDDERRALYRQQPRPARVRGLPVDRVPMVVPSLSGPWVVLAGGRSLARPRLPATGPPTTRYEVVRAGRGRPDHVGGRRGGQGTEAVIPARGRSASPAGANSGVLTRNRGRRH